MGDRSQTESAAAHWLWGVFAALAVMFVAAFVGTDVLTHGSDAKWVASGVALAAIVVCLCALCRWAVLYGRAKPKKAIPRGSARVARIILALVWLAGVALYFFDVRSRTLWGLGVMVVCGGSVVLGYFEDPARFHRPVRVFPSRRRD